MKEEKGQGVLSLDGVEKPREKFKVEWELVNETLGSGYHFWDPLPWPPAPPDRGWLSNEAKAVEAYLAALGKRQQDFEREVLSRLERLERVLREVDDRTVGMMPAF